MLSYLIHNLPVVQLEFNFFFMRRIVYLLNQTRLMSSNSEKSNDVQLLATYGTLRDDDDSGAPWRIAFIQVSFHIY